MYSLIPGVLLGRSNEGNVEVSEVVPVFHSNVFVPSLELAFEAVLLYLFID